MKVKLRSIEDLDKINHNKMINLDEKNKIRSRDLQRTLNLVMKMDIPVLDMIAKASAIAGAVFTFIVLTKVW